MIIQSKKVWIADQFISAAVELEQGKITGIFPYGEKQADVDYGSKRIVPGFMDIHCHGAYEFDTNDAKPEGLRYWAKHIVSEGVTSFLATTVTQSVEVLTNAVANVADVMEGSYEGAEILGIHFEGPYLDMKYKGAQPPEYIAKPSVEQFKHYQQAARGHIRYVTLAPEHDEGFALTHYLTEHGVVVSIGHSAACDAFFYRGKDVAVLGSGEYALHEVQALLPVAKSVALLTNGAPLTADFPPEVTVYPQAVEAVLGETVVTGVQLSGGVQLPVSGVFVALGVAGSTALARKIGAEVDGNRIVVDEKMQTTVPGLYAAGDCTGGLLQVAKAVYEGAQAGTEAAKALRKG